MKNNKGFTLIEIILAIALLGIISVMIFPALTNQYVMMRKTRVLTSDLYTAQQKMELGISSAKKSIQNNEEPAGLTRTSYSLFGKTIVGYPNQVEVHVGNAAIKLKTIVADSRMPSFDVATATNVSSKFADATKDLPYAYTNTPSLWVDSTSTILDPKHVFLTSISRWYVSREGFNIPMLSEPKLISEIEKGTIYPRFPEDYTIIPGAKAKDLTAITAAYAGRHLLYTITPASTSGKMGSTVSSNPVFVSGLPAISNLSLHLDASMISKEKVGTEVSTATVDGKSVFYVSQWNDISGKNNNATPLTASAQPELVEAYIGNFFSGGKEFETYAKFVRFDGNKGLTISDKSSLDSNNLTVFAVIKTMSTTTQKSIVSKIGAGNGWFLGWTDDKTLGFSIKSGANTDTVRAGSVGAAVALDGKWHILRATSELALQVDSTAAYTTPRTADLDITNGDSITIGFAGGSNYSVVDIAEILIYDGIVGADDVTKINTYFKNKYQPVPPAVSIYALQPVLATVIENEPYSPPATVQAYMSNGTMKSVAVTWSPATIDTTSVGVKTSTATATADSTKMTTLEVTVVN